MTKQGPYRGRLDETDSVDAYFGQLHRRRRWRRALPGIIAFLALSPAVAIAFSGRTPPRASPVSLTPALERFGEDSWGLVISAERVRPWWGVPHAARRPSSEDSPISAASVQAAVLAYSAGLRDCYLQSEAYESRFDGELVASLLIRKDGEVEAAVRGDGELRRAGVSACVVRVLESLSFRAPDPEYGWIHLPLRFQP